MTRTENYLPETGTSTARLVAFVHSLATDVECTTGHITEATGLDSQTVTAVAETPVKHGMIVREKVGTRWLYRRGPTQVSDEFIRANSEGFKPVQIDPGLRETLLSLHPISRPDLSPRMITNTPIVAPAMEMREAMRRPPRREETAPLTAGLWSDGRLTIERDGSEPIVFTQTETFHLIKFLAACGRLRDILQGEAST